MSLILFIGKILKLFYLLIISCYEEMSSTFRQWKNKLHCSHRQSMNQNQLFVEDEFKNVHNVMDSLVNENNALKTRLDLLENRYERWIHDEQTYLNKRIEYLENENHQLHELYISYQMQNETCMRSMTDLIMKILLTQQERRKERVELYHENDAAQWRTEQQQDDDNRCTTNDQTTWLDQRLMNADEHDQQTRNHSSEYPDQLLTLATVKSKSERSSTGLTNKLYYLLSNEKSPCDNQRLPSVNIVPVNDPHTIPRKQQSTITINPKNKSTPQYARTTYSNHERLSTQTPVRTTTVVKNTSTTSPAKPIRVQATPVRASTTTAAAATATTNRPRPTISTTTYQKTTSSTSIPTKPSRPRYTLAKSSEPLRTVTPTPPTSTRTSASKSTKPAPATVKARPPPVTHQSARVSDLDALIAQRQAQTKAKKPTSIPVTSVTNNKIRQSLFTKNTVKLVRPVRSQELKTFSCHLTPEVPNIVSNEVVCQTNESLSTLTPPSLESITETKTIEKKEDSSTPSIAHDFSEDSLNEHHHGQKLVDTNASMSTKENNHNHHLRDQSSGSDISPIILIKTETSADSAYCNGSLDREETNTSDGYFLLPDDQLTSKDNPYSTKSSSVSQKSVVHRLVFPGRLGRMIFFRRILSDSDIYQKICSKDSEITHNVYHLDTIRDYSMEF
ncbi:unnamed protein product, partial [Adineta ricciae]